MGEYTARVAQAALRLEAIKLDPNHLFVWSSGYQMPIYNDNRLFMSSVQDRGLVLDALENLIQEKGMGFEVVAGTSTAGIPWAAWLAHRRDLPMVYIRDKPKDHGLRNQIEGITADKGLEGRKTVVIEDLISTGGSSVKAVEAVRQAGGNCVDCVSIFNYGFGEAVSRFGALTPPCQVSSVLDYKTLVEVAIQTGYVEPQSAKVLKEWDSDPFGFGEKHGFPKIERGK
ncbi:MAG TPA: orotate phosphoribosyltransferase [Candidatus Nanoarchaeia archaeon]|nr:orotate phosphoribosyltransferase [Candidatus Nanoarchaeia archaeon]